MAEQTMNPKTCPFKGPNPEPKRVFGGVQSDVPSNACTTTGCMLFVPFVQDGKIIGGNCGLALASISLMQIEQHMIGGHVERAETPTDLPKKN